MSRYIKSNGDTLEKPEIYDVAFGSDDYAGYMFFQVLVDGYALEGLFRVYDPINGDEMKIVSIDYGYLHPAIDKYWDELEQECRKLATKKYRELTGNSYVKSSKSIKASKTFRVFFTDGTDSDCTASNLAEARKFAENYLRAWDIDDAEVEYVVEKVEPALLVKIKDWYKSTFPWDAVGDDISDITFQEFYDGMQDHIDVYGLLGDVDSIVRERVFAALADILNVDYDEVYDLWMSVE